VAFEYLSDEQARRYGAFVAAPSPEELERFFFLNAEALELARTKRRRHNRLGWAVQWGTVRMLEAYLKGVKTVDRARERLLEEAIDRALEQEAECSEVLHNISACRGAMDALMAEVIEGHIRFHILDPKVAASDEQAKAADDLIHALRAYLK